MINLFVYVTLLELSSFTQELKKRLKKYYRKAFSLTFVSLISFNLEKKFSFTLMRSPSAKANIMLIFIRAVIFHVMNPNFFCLWDLICFFYFSNRLFYNLNFLVLY